MKHTPGTVTIRRNWFGWIYVVRPDGSRFRVKDSQTSGLNEAIAYAASIGVGAITVSPLKVPPGIVLRAK